MYKLLNKCFIDTYLLFLTQLKDFVLSQPDAYEVKIGDQIFRRPGDPPFDDVFQKHYGDEDRVDYTSQAKNDDQEKDEL